MWNNYHFFLATHSNTRKAEWVGVLSWWGMRTLNSMFQAICHSACSDWYKWDSHPVNTFMDGDSAVFKDKFLQLINFFICFVCRWTTQVFSAFIRGHTTFEFGKTFKNFKFFSFSSLPKLLSTLQKFARYLSPSFKQNIKHMLPSSSLLFSRNAKIMYGTTYTWT